MSVISNKPAFKVSALFISSVFAAIALSGNALAADDGFNQNSSRSNNAGALHISLSGDEDGDTGAQVEELSSRMQELETLLSSITLQLEQAEALQTQITDLQAQLAQQSAGKVNYQDISIMKIVEDAASEFEARVASESGGALTADLQLQLDELVAAASASSSTDPALMEAFSSSLSVFSSSLSSLSSTVEELSQQLSVTYDMAKGAGYDLKKNVKI